MFFGLFYTEKEIVELSTKLLFAFHEKVYNEVYDKYCSKDELLDITQKFFNVNRKTAMKIVDKATVSVGAINTKKTKIERRGRHVSTTNETLKKGQVYVILSNATGNIKIGMTRGSFKERWNSLKTGFEMGGVLIAQYFGNDCAVIEKETHRRFKYYHIDSNGGSEWFKGDCKDDVIAYLQKMQDRNAQ